MAIRPKRIADGDSEDHSDQISGRRILVAIICIVRESVYWTSKSSI
jgi:hypothetical protein